MTRQILHVDERSQAIDIEATPILGLPPLIPEAEFGKALDSLVITCVDIVLLRDRQVLLARRNRYPRKSWWIVGGRMFPGESPVQAAQRKTKDEAGLYVTGDRFRFVGVYSTVFAQRSQPPYENGLHSVNLTFAVEVSATEREQITLTDDEYDEWRWIDLAQVPHLLDETQPMDQCLSHVMSDVVKLTE